VTLRAVGEASGISHNAPYKHFADRSALMAAVATRDFMVLTEALKRAGEGRAQPLTKLRRALQAFVDYSSAYPARYRLLFGDPDIATHGGELERAAMNTFAAFAAIVGECQSAKQLPQVPTVPLAGLIYASVHGLVDLHASGRMRSEKGFRGVAGGVDLLISVLSEVGR
jgi:AcrR family transcriptional regulator